MATITLIDPAWVPYFSTFLFVFALIFGLLSYSKVGDFNKRVNAMLALAIAGFSVLYEPLVVTLSQYIPIAASVLIIVFFLALVKKIFEGKDSKQAKDYFPLIVVIAILFLLLIAFADVFLAFLPGNFDSSVVLWGVGIVFVLLFFWLVYKTGD